MTVHPAVRPDAKTPRVGGAPLYSLTAEVSPDVLDGDWVSERDRDVFMWEVPARRTRLIGLGASMVHYRHGPLRFAEMAEAVAATLGRVRRLDDIGPGPRAVGGFGFDHEDPAPNGSWGGFPAACMVIPETCLVREGGRAWVIATTTGDDIDPERAKRHLSRRIAAVVTPPKLDADPVAVVRPADEGRTSYRSLVAEAAAAIAAGEFSKLVVARSVDIATAARADRVIDALRTRYPACVTFAISSGDRVYLGATPELLIARQGDEVTSVALAGTIARGTDPAADDNLADRLIADPKESEEHQHVVTGIRDSLMSEGATLEPTGSPGIRKLATVQHLETRIRGHVAGASLIDLVGALHPTPAVGGTPRSSAADWISGHEGMERGWYAAPIGYVDSEGNGEFHVALRGALLEGGVARCYVGAGIVAGSDPDRELAETTAKLRAIAEALGG